VLVNDVIELANDQLPVRTDMAFEFDNTEDKWTFARLAGGAIEPGAERKSRSFTERTTP
jgi:hypothetical protein